MSKMATERVDIFCPHADKIPHKAFEADDPMIMIFGKFYLLPREFYVGASVKPINGNYFESVGLKFPISFCNRCVEKVNFGEIIKKFLNQENIEAVRAMKDKLLSSDPELKRYVVANGEAPYLELREPVAKKTISCLNAGKFNRSGQPYHPKQFENETSDIIIRMDCTLRPSEYTAYVSEQTWKFNVVMDACEHCVERVLPEVSTMIDRYHTMLILSDSKVHDPDTMMSMHQVAFLSGMPEATNINQ